MVLNKLTPIIYKSRVFDVLIIINKIYKMQILKVQKIMYVRVLDIRVKFTY